jgi:hypothetical protein
VLQNKLTLLIAQLPKPFIICSDSNAHHLSRGPLHPDPRGTLLHKWIHDSNLFLLNTSEPTYLTSSGNYSHIDLSITTADMAPYYTWTPHSSPCTSDHFPLVLSTLTKPYTDTASWQTRSANWPQFQTSLNLPSNFLSPTQACGTVVSSILKAAPIHFPKPERKLRHPSLCWWTEEYAATHRAKNRALSRFKNYPSNVDLWVAFKHACAIFRNTVVKSRKTSRNDFLSNIASNAKSAVVWKKDRSLSTKTAPRSLVLTQQDNTVAEPEQVSECLALHFSRRSGGRSNDPRFEARRDQVKASPPSFNRGILFEYFFSSPSFIFFSNISAGYIDAMPTAHD